MDILQEKEIVDLYLTKTYSLRMLANEFNTNHHRIKRILVRNGIAITRAKINREVTEETRERMRKMAMGRPAHNKGKKMPENLVRKNMVAKTNLTLEDIACFDDIEKLKFFTRTLSKHKKYFETKQKKLEFINKFYFSDEFCFLYNRWIEKERSELYRPTLDHKQSKFNGGNWELDNLQYITWFENRCKWTFNREDWDLFKKETNTISDLFV